MSHYEPQYDLTKLPDPMFTKVVRGYGFEPTAEDIEKQQQAIRFNKVVSIKGYHVRTFDLSQQDQVEAYRALYMSLYDKAKAGELVIHVMERRFVENPTPRWMTHIEYSEYELDKKDITEKPKDEKKGTA